MHDCRPKGHFYSCDKQIYKNGKFKYIKNRNGDLFAGGTKRSSYKDFELQDGFELSYEFFFNYTGLDENYMMNHGGFDGLLYDLECSPYSKQ